MTLFSSALCPTQGSPLCVPASEDHEGNGDGRWHPGPCRRVTLWNRHGPDQRGVPEDDWPNTGAVHCCKFTHNTGMIYVWYKILEGLYLYVEYCILIILYFGSFRYRFSYQSIMYFDWQDDISGDYRNVILALVVGGPPPNTAAKCKSFFPKAWILPPTVSQSSR